MIILGIETSCDETSAAVVKDGTKILSNIVASSQDIHVKTGGIIPEIAARQQIASIISVTEMALCNAFQNSKYKSLNSKQSQKTNSKNIKPISDQSSQISKHIDIIAVTYGPGLIGSLLVGVETAKTLSFLWDKPIVPINHLVGHIYANWLSRDTRYEIRDTKTSPEFKKPTTEDRRPKPEFPAVAMVVSGGHTDLVVMKNHGDLEWLGGTRDDAAGEAFDKTARLLGLPYPGGPAISAEALQLKTKDKKLNLFPRPMINSVDFDFSFSGLKTSVLTKTEELKNRGTKKLSIKEIQLLSAEVQEAIVDVLVAKSKKAIKKYKPKSFLLAGGVAANKRLRQKLELEIRSLSLEIDLFIPPPSLCTDNATFIASAAYFNYKPVSWEEIKANPQQRIHDTNLRINTNAMN